MTIEHTSQQNKTQPSGANISEVAPRHVRFFTLTNLLLTLIILFGIVWRLWGINFGLPYLYDPDEPLYVGPALNILANRDLNPHWFNNPGTTTIYILAGVYALSYVGGLVTGRFSSPASFQTMYYQDPTLVYLSGRLSIAIFGILTIWLVYLLGRKLANPVVGLIAAALMAVLPLHIELSQLIRTDVQMTFFVLVAFWFALKIVKDRTWASYLLAGLFTGIAVITKYPAAVFGLTLLVAHLLATDNYRLLRNHLKLAGSGLAFVLGAFISSPYLFLNVRQALDELAFELRTQHLSATGGGFFPNLAWYIQQLANNFTVIGLALAVIGLALCVTSKNKQKILFVVFPASFVIFISFASLRWDRWVLPAIPFLVLAAGFALYQAANRLPSRLAVVFGLIVLIPVLVPLANFDVVRASTIAGGDTRTDARQWILNNLPRGSNLLVEVYGPELPKDQYNYYRVVNGKVTLYDISLLNHMNFRPGGRVGQLVSEADIDKIQYVILSSSYARYQAEAAAYPHEVKVYEQIIAAGKLLYQISPGTGQRAGPPITIYQLDPSLLTKDFPAKALQSSTSAPPGDTPGDTGNEDTNP